MVKIQKLTFSLLIMLFVIPYLCTVSKSSHEAEAGYFKDLVIGEKPDDAGMYITSRGGWRLIEFWHYSGGYWKATISTDGNDFKELIIKDNEAENGRWTDVNFLTKKIYENKFILEYKIYHPKEVLDALTSGAIITPVMNIDTETLKYFDEYTIPSKFFNFLKLPIKLSNDLPEKPECKIYNEYLIVRALPRLNCIENTYIQKNLNFYYPYDIPLIQTGFGSLGYAMFYNNKAEKPGTKAGVAYSPDPFYGSRYTIPFHMIEDISGKLKENFLVTVKEDTERIDEKSEILNIGHGTFANAGAISIRFWYPIRIDYYAQFPTTVTPTPTPSPTLPPPPPERNRDITENLTPVVNSSMDEEAAAVIAADDRGNEKFDVVKGIPVRENLYVNIKTREYLYDLTFTKHSYTDTETVYVRKTYHLSWREDHGRYETTYCGSGTFYHIRGTYCEDSDGDGINDTCPGHKYSGCVDSDGDGEKDSCPGHDTWVSNWVDMSDTVVVYSEPYTLTRGYSYWTVDTFEAFIPEKVTVENAALPGGKVTIPQNGIPVPEITLSHSNSIPAHVLNNPISDAIESGTLVYDHTVGSYVIDLGTEHINGSTSRPSVPDIKNHDKIIERAIPQYHTKNDLLIFNGMTIMDDTVSTSGKAPEPSAVPESVICHENAFYAKGLTIPDNTLNGVHESKGTITYRRLAETVNPKRPEKIEIPISPINSVRVHTPVVCSSGVLDDVKNDQTLNPDRSRSALVLGRPSRIRIFTVGNHLNIKGYSENRPMDCRKYTRDRQVRFPFDVYIGTDKPDNSRFVPANTWYSIPLDEAYDEINIYIPTWVPEGDYEVEFRQIAVNAPDLNTKEYLANLNINNYVAVRNSPVRVIGRIYGFRVTGIADKLWENVFRKSKGTSGHTGNCYYVGTRDEEGKDRGISPLFTLPILEGSHAVYKNRGALKTGYTFRFDLTTVGCYYGDNDHISIIPEFYYVRKDGTGRQKVDLWYHEEFSGKMNYFVKIEPTGRNRDNPKFMKLGDIYRNVPEEEITNTARILGLNADMFRNRLSPIGWLDRIVLSKYQRTFTGNTENLPPGVNADRVLQSVQRWYGEYYIPNDVYAAPAGFDVAEYGRKNNGLTGRESFWLKDGYIIVNFRIETIKNGDFDSPVLSYWGAQYCNMFEREGFSHTKTDYYGATFELKDGDIVFYDTDKRSSDDYRTGGTH
ncbi:hypothetical protein CSTERLE_00560 [Thermoclostridium stercorarium subsp. leptospartum DSM 9219]|uniref:DUF5704 domain-containing protein n=1 Tax=Thermoclostridium stercorarium subsp. leptospartum DSM 9219 TaxID=1346611 RepID=A0A1B1YHE1_THEST|nr:DUF5704 domain-containing protein [Thermoclostridium stercorarium]ANX00190.1 hypothetical protein CSTERLE_00560 [Thermoclostridium stercorarium subsp. leptospartum DSM 9219]